MLKTENLPSAIGFEIVRDKGKDYVVVTEAREFQADGTPPAFPALQTGSVSTWELEEDGTLIPINLDVLAGTDLFDGERTACWIEFSRDEETFWVSNALDASISSYSFNEGQIELIELLAAVGEPPVVGDPFGTTDGFIDLWISNDGKYLYQLFGLDGTIGVYQIEDNGNGSSLTHIQEVSDLPVITLRESLPSSFRFSIKYAYFSGPDNIYAGPAFNTKEAEKNRISQSLTPSGKTILAITLRKGKNHVKNTTNKY